MSGIAVIGGGAVGGFAATLLARAGHTVTVCVRTPFDGLVLDTPSGKLRADVTVSSSPDAQEPADWVLLTTKVQDTASAAPWLARLVGRRSVLVVMQNGLDHAARVAGFVTAGEVLPALVYAPVERVAPGHVVWHSEGRFVVPNGPGAHAFAELFSGTGADVSVAEDFRTAAWLKLLSNVGANPLTALTMRRVDVLGEPDIRELAMRLMTEAAAVARADGAEVDEQRVTRIGEAFDRLNPDGGSSMLYDRLAGRPMEHEHIVGPVVSYAEKHGVDVPVNRAVLALLRALR